MRFALLGDHPDGIELAQALLDSGRHAIVGCSGLRDEGAWQRLGSPRRVSDVEELLADPAVELVIVAGAPTVRGAQLRRAVQSERLVVCVHPADEKVDTAYEAALIAGDTALPLLPLLPEGLHPAVRRLAAFVGPESPIGPFRLLTFERSAAGDALDNATVEGMRPSVPGWDVLRSLGGEIAEVSSLTEAEDLLASRPVLVAGSFEKGGLFQMTLVPDRRVPLWRMVVIGGSGEVELTFPQGWIGPAILEWHEGGERREEYFERWDAGPALVEQVEAMAEGRKGSLTWQDEVRCLELDDAARGSARSRRANRMEYQEASEEVGFKGTMTLLGCAVLWSVLVLVILARWYPWVGWLILPILLVFIGLQALRAAVRKEKGDRGEPGASAPGG
jgi:predicted dehydrogenase